MKVNLERQGINVVQLGLELEPDKAIKAYEVACRQLSAKVNIPGFRRGKAPRNIIEKYYGIDYIKREALEKLLPELLGKVIADESLEVINRPEIGDCKFELGQPLTLQAKLEVRPEVKLGQYLGLAVNVPSAQMPDDALARSLAGIADSKSSLKEVDDRPAQMGDSLVLDWICSIDGKEVEGGKAEGLMLTVKEGSFLPGFCEQLVGHKAGSRCQVKATFPPEYRNKELAAKEATFAVDVRSVKQRFVPAIDDELAKAVGAQGLDELQDMLKARLEEELQEENQARSQRAVVDAVIENATVEIPDSMVEREKELLMNSLRHMVEHNAQSWDEFKQEPEYGEIDAAKSAEARQRVLTSLVLGAVVRAEKMTVSQEEFAPYLEGVAHQLNVPVERIMDSEEMMRQVMEEVLTRKVIEYLISQAKINFIQDEKAEKPQEVETCRGG